MPVAVAIKYKPKTRIEQLSMFVSIYCALKSVVISDSCIQMAAVFIEYGINDKTKKFLMDDLKLFKTIGSYRNALTSLKNNGILVHDGYKNGYKLHQDLAKRDNEDIDLIIRIEKPKV